MSIRFLIPWAILCIASAAPAEVVIFDHFDDGVLGDEWEVVFNEFACGWTAVEAESILHATEICHTDPGGEWARVYLRQPCLLADDFNTAIHMSWNSQSISETRQFLYLFLLDADNHVIAYSGYRDCWTSWTGEILASVTGSDAYYSGHNSMPYNGDARINLNREDGLITCRWDSETILEAPESTGIANIEIVFGHMKRTYYDDPLDLSVDYVRCQDTAAVSATEGVGEPRPIRLVNHPNPFNPQTAISFTLDRDCHTTIAVHDLTGRLVDVLASRVYEVGDHAVLWKGVDAMGRTVPSGTYVVHLQAGSSRQVRKVQLIR